MTVSTRHEPRAQKATRVRCWLCGWPVRVTTTAPDAHSVSCLTCGMTVEVHSAAGAQRLRALAVRETVTSEPAEDRA